MFDETFVRAWRLYLVGSIAAFVAGRLQLFQVLFARTGAKNRSVDARACLPRSPLRATRRKLPGSRAIGRAVRDRCGSRSRRSRTSSATSRAAPPRGACRSASSITCSRSTARPAPSRSKGSRPTRPSCGTASSTRLPAARRARAQAHHGRRRHGRHRHRIDLLPLWLRARRAARGGRAVARRHDRHGARRQRARRPVRRAAELLRHARLHPAREDRAAPGGPVRAPARAEIRRRRRAISKRCASRRSRPTCSSSKGCSSRTAATS